MSTEVHAVMPTDTSTATAVTAQNHRKRVMMDGKSPNSGLSLSAGWTNFKNLYKRPYSGSVMHITLKTTQEYTIKAIIARSTEPV
mmetsp:Transcript_49482/g.111053  ORF Transcript_49482/g.111053 Transcript_49482/m.111053 type:complete len:85 (-) Transcript_49482:966-1220(-)